MAFVCAAWAAWGQRAHRVTRRAAPGFRLERTLMKRCLFAALALANCWGPVAIASTLPPLEFRANQVILGLGVLDANLDYAVSDRLSLGVCGSFNVAPLAGRASYRLGEAAGLSYGVTLSAGINNMWGSPGALAVSTWFQPAAIVALRLGGAESRMTLRGTIGPLFLATGSGNYATSGALAFWPNLELTYRLNVGQEVTLGGNSLVGWRGTW